MYEFARRCKGKIAAKPEILERGVEGGGQLPRKNSIKVEEFDLGTGESNLIQFLIGHGFCYNGQKLLVTG